MGRSLKVPISFKQSEKSMYDFLQSKLSPSVYIKEFLIREMKKEGLSLVDHREEVEKEVIKPVQNFEF
ncbi:MAG: hypothetical protein ACRC30_11185 [Clostridium sp.]